MNIERIMTSLEAKHPGESEYLQAVKEVLLSIEDIYNQHPEFEKAKIIERLVEPDRIFTFRVTWVDDKGEVQTNLGYRVQFNNAIGPYKGGIRFHRYEMQDVVIVDGRARGIIAKNLVTGKLERFAAHAVVIATGGYGNAYFLSTNAMGCNCTAAVSCYRKGAVFANPAYVQIHPTCIPVHGDKQSKLTLMSESLRNDGRIWVPKKKEDAVKLQKGEIKGSDIPEEDRDYYLERRYPAFGNLVPRDVASRAAKERCDAGFGVNNTGLAVFLDSPKLSTVWASTLFFNVTATSSICMKKSPTLIRANWQKKSMA